MSHESPFEGGPTTFYDTYGRPFTRTLQEQLDRISTYTAFSAHLSKIW
jgi:hypothetical protein